MSTHSHTHTHTHTHVSSHKYTHTHTLSHTHILTQTRTHTHTHIEPEAKGKTFIFIPLISAAVPCSSSAAAGAHTGLMSTIKLTRHKNLFEEKERGNGDTLENNYTHERLNATAASPPAKFTADVSPRHDTGERGKHTGKK